MDRQYAIDQYLCERAFQALVLRVPMLVGTTVTEFDVRIKPGLDGIEHIETATVEQRHLDAAARCYANYPVGHEPGTVAFAVAPPE